MPEEIPNDPRTNAEIIGGSVANIVAAVAPFLGPYGALTALLATTLSKLAPELYADIVALAQRGTPVTPEEEAALDAKIAKLKNPDGYFET